MTGSDLADEMRARGLNWTAQTVSEIETGRRHISLGELLTLAEVWNRPVARLLELLPGERMSLNASSEVDGRGLLDRLAGLGAEAGWRVVPPTLGYGSKHPGVPLAERLEVGDESAAADLTTRAGRIALLLDVEMIDPTDEATWSRRGRLLTQYERDAIALHRRMNSRRRSRTGRRGSGG